MNPIRQLIRWGGANFWRYLFLSKLKVCSQGKESKVNYWRIMPSTGSHFMIGSQSLVRADIVFERPKAVVKIGDRTYLGRAFFSIAESLNIGDDVLISWNVTICDHNSHSIRFSKRARDVQNALKDIKNWDAIKVAPIKIENKVWLGFGCTLLKGVTIGEGAIVAAGAVVTKDVAPWTIVGGNPASLIREILEDER